MTTFLMTICFRTFCSGVRSPFDLHDGNSQTIRPGATIPFREHSTTQIHVASDHIELGPRIQCCICGAPFLEPRQAQGPPLRLVRLHRSDLISLRRRFGDTSSPTTSSRQRVAEDRSKTLRPGVLLHGVFCLIRADERVSTLHLHGKEME